MADVLAAIDARWNTPLDNREAYEVIFRLLGMDERPGLAYGYLYMLDVLELTEHGGTVGGCWLTDKGKEVLTAIREFVPVMQEEEHD